MAIAMNGAAAIISSGNTTASARIRTAAARDIASNGDDSSTIGTSVIAQIVQSGVMPALAATAAAPGSTIGSANASSAVRRAGSRGQSVSATAAADGRIIKTS